MVKPQLIEYIEDQLNQGFSFDAIGEALLSQGWELEEIQEAFASFEYVEGGEMTEQGEVGPVTVFDQILRLLGLPTNKLTSNVVIALLGVLTFVILVALFYTSSLAKTEVSMNSEASDNSEIAPITVANTDTNNLAKEDAKTVESSPSLGVEGFDVESDNVIDDTGCSDDFHCFITASESCDDANVRVFSEKIDFGKIVLSDISYEMTKSSDGGCVFTTVINETTQASDRPLFGKESVCVYADYAALTNYLRSIGSNIDTQLYYDSDKEVAEIQAEISGASYCYGPFFGELEYQLSFD